MGSVSFHVEPGTPTIDVLRQEIGSAEILAHGSGPGGHYLAVRYRPGEPVRGLVAVIRRGRGYYNFSLKWVGEEMGPFDCGAPARVLDALDDPPENDYAAEWRRKCRERLAHRATLKAVKAGTWVRLAEPIPFSDGVDRDTFQYEGRGSDFRDRNGLRLRLRGWRERPLVILGEVLPA